MFAIVAALHVSNINSNTHTHSSSMTLLLGICYQKQSIIKINNCIKRELSVYY